MMNDYFLFKCDETEIETQEVLDKRLEYVIKKYEEKTNGYNKKKFIIDKYNRVYVFDDKYAVYVGIMCTLMMPWEKKEYKYLGSDEYINKRYSIIIRDLVYDDRFTLDETAIANECNTYFGFTFVINDCIDQYEMRQLARPNDDKFYIIAELLEKQVNLYKLLEKNQRNQTIENNYDIKEVVNYFEKVLNLIEKELSTFKIQKYSINKYEKALLVEDTLVIYIGMKGKRALFKDKNKKNGNVADRYSLIIQELTYNELFNSKKFSKFLGKIHIITASYVGAENYNNIYYRPFTTGNTKERIYNSYHPSICYESNFDYVNEKLPELNLLARHDSWPGFKYYYIVYELRVNNIIGLAVTRTTDSHPNYMGRTLIKEYEHFKMRSYDAFSFDNNWSKCMEILLNEAKQKKWENVKRNKISYSLLAEKVSYYTLPIYIKDKNTIIKKQNEILVDARENINKEMDRQVYDLIDYKWKSEELLLECVKKVFKKNTVIHQYRPHFLRQLSYDVFVCGKNIAFEYQGKQHFEPVEIFGGEENFKKQRERDELKKKLSDENGVKLIYINYWEDITTDLIKEKLKDDNIHI